ncbi:hypothetical protein Bca52824_089496 [Brassica carinata]|uniref:PPIase cyclophilin-type domain-containing protein n=1 Tax=Brassica carinata TaxID=52824 RepID=A0A8X7PFB6_BRACI|nr:hypothetical protein Bca52824_089496 [Brassica carinata]
MECPLGFVFPLQLRHLLYLCGALRVLSVLLSSVASKKVKTIRQFIFLFFGFAVVVLTLDSLSYTKNMAKRRIRSVEHLNFVSLAFPEVAPKTSENFRALCTGEKGIGPRSGKPLHYKGSFFHRILKGSSAQAGDFVNRDGTGGESIYAGKFPDESPKLRHDEPGLLSMPVAERDKLGSHFQITFRPNHQLDRKNVVFGKLIQGKEVLKKIERVGDEEGKPTVTVKIIRCGEYSGDKKKNTIDDRKRSRHKKSSRERRKKRRRHSSSESESSSDSETDSSESDSESDSDSSSDLSSSSHERRKKRKRSSKKDKHRRSKRRDKRHEKRSGGYVIRDRNANQEGPQTIL